MYIYIFNIFIVFFFFFRKEENLLIIMNENKTNDQSKLNFGG